MASGTTPHKALHLGRPLRWVSVEVWSHLHMCTALPALFPLGLVVTRRRCQ
jgi:hypothetical protein